MEDDDDDILDNEMHGAETGSTTWEVSSLTASTHPKRKRKNSEGNRWMGTAANALTQLTNHVAIMLIGPHSNYVYFFVAREWAES